MLIVLVSFVTAEVEDDFDEDITVEDDNGEADTDDGVTVEKIPVDIKYLSPDDNVDFYFMDHFDTASSLGVKWTRSQAKKDGADDSIAKYDGQWENGRQHGEGTYWAKPDEKPRKGIWVEGKRDRWLDASTSGNEPTKNTTTTK